jgi:uncharacterized cupin superfamily protein
VTPGPPGQKSSQFHWLIPEEAYKIFLKGEVWSYCLNNCKILNAVSSELCEIRIGIPSGHG